VTGVAPPIDELPRHELARGLSASRQGKHPLLCWSQDRVWVVTRPHSAHEASRLLTLQKKRGIQAVLFNEADATELLRGDQP